MGKIRNRTNMKRIDSDKLARFVADNKVNKKAVCAKVGVSRCYINDVIKRGITRIAFFNLLCDELGVNRDYFDYKEEPVITEEKPSITEDLNYNLKLIRLLLDGIYQSNLELNSKISEVIDTFPELDAKMSKLIDIWSN